MASQTDQSEARIRQSGPIRRENFFAKSLHGRPRQGAAEVSGTLELRNIAKINIKRTLNLYLNQYHNTKRLETNIEELTLS